MLFANMAEPSGERVAETLNIIFNENTDANKSFSPEKGEPSLNVRSVGKVRVVKSPKVKAKPHQQTRHHHSVSSEFLEDSSDDIFGNSLLKEDKDQPADIKLIEAGIENPSADSDELGICAESNDNVCFTMDVKNNEEKRGQNDLAEENHLDASGSDVNTAPSCVDVCDGNVGSDVNSYETNNAYLSLHAIAADISSFGNEKTQFNFSMKIPEKDQRKKGKQFESSSKTCTSMSVPPDEVVIEAMKLIFDENIDATRIFALEKKEPSRLASSSHEEEKESGRVKTKAKPRKYWSVLDDLLDDDSDDIFGPAFSKQNETAVTTETNVALEVKQSQLAVEESSRNSLDSVPEKSKNSEGKTQEDLVDINCDSLEGKIKLMQKPDAASQYTSSAVVSQRLQIENQEKVSDTKGNLHSVEHSAKDESDSASDCAATVQRPLTSSPLENKVISSEMKDLPASEKVNEISLLSNEKSNTNLPTPAPNKRKNNDLSANDKVLDVISSSSVSEKQDTNPCKKRKQTGSTVDSELMRNGPIEAENMLTEIQQFNFANDSDLVQTFTGCQRNSEEATRDREEQLVHFRTVSSKSKPCQPCVRFDDDETEALFGSRKNKVVPSVEKRLDKNVVKKTTENSVNDTDLLRVSDPLLNTPDSSDNSEPLLNTDLLRNRKLERTENLHEDLILADSKIKHTPLEAGQSKFLSNAFLLCASGILLVAVPSLLLLFPVYILALFNAVFLVGMLMVGAMVFRSCRGKEKKRVRNTNASVKDLQLSEIKYFKAPDDAFKGWMNELVGSYDVSDFHISHLRSVYVSLSGISLRLQIPKKRIPKRAIHSECLPPPGSFIKQFHYDLSGSKVTTVPEGLVLRRLWSKKYPILIEIPASQKSKKESQHIDKMGRCAVGQEMDRLNETNCTRLFLFARTCREKEEWFRRFLSAALGSPLSSCPDSSVRNTPSGTSIGPDSSENRKDNPCESMLPSDDQNYSHYLLSMSKVLSMSNESICDPQLLWLNAFISRCTMDVLQESHWIEAIKQKLEKKLLTAKIPNFMDDVKLVEFDLGKEVPLICRATLPSLDDQGLWVDLEIIYGGQLRCTIETKCNLLKLQGTSPKDKPRVCKSSAATNSDEEDSGESSTGDSSDNEEFDEIERPKPRVNWLLGLADRITSSRHFQNAMKIDQIKKIMEKVSSKSLMLSVELHGLKGTMAVNIPPPPTDRIWYGFRHMPDLEMSVEVQVGQRQITLTPLTNWIEKKLIVELERALVMPNMDDILFPLMCDHVTNVHVSPTGNSETE